MSLVKAITDSVCRWSVAATGTVAGLGDSCCALMLEAVLQDRGQMLGQDGKSLMKLEAFEKLIGSHRNILECEK